MKRLSDLSGRLFGFLATIAALLLLAMVVVVTADIVLRNVARIGFPWANEVTEYALYLTTLVWQDPDTWGGLTEAPEIRLS